VEFKVYYTFSVLHVVCTCGSINHANKKNITTISKRPPCRDNEDHGREKTSLFRKRSIASHSHDKLIYLKCTKECPKYGQVLPKGNKTHGKLHRAPANDKKGKVMHGPEFSEEQIARELTVIKER
jgi:hypothetical protein